MGQCCSVKIIKEVNGKKPCPKCGSLISKINGCDQIWCIRCKTTFNWNTGRRL